KNGPSSGLIPSHAMPSRIARTTSSELRCSSVSSIRRTNVPPLRRAWSQLKIAVRAPPTWRNPVGEGAKRTQTLIASRPASVLLLDSGPRVLEGDRPVEDRCAGRRVGVLAEVPQPLELDGGPDGKARGGPIDEAARERLQRAGIDHRAPVAAVALVVRV